MRVSHICTFHLKTEPLNSVCVVMFVVMCVVCGSVWCGVWCGVVCALCGSVCSGGRSQEEG